MFSKDISTYHSSSNGFATRLSDGEIILIFTNPLLSAMLQLNSQPYSFSSLFSTKSDGA